MIIFLISGKSESGKDTFYELAKPNLIDYGFNPVRLAFADEVKEVAKSMGWNGIKDEKGRSGLIMIGDGARNLFDGDIWVKKLVNKLVNNLKHLEDVVFITDCRYPNEISKVKEWAESNNHLVYAIRVERPNHTSKLTGEQKGNESETALDYFSNWDVIMYNSGTLNDYRIQVKMILEKYLK